MVTAIKWSCNVFFYDVGRRLTSDVYDAYAYKLGLGQRTGVEVGEALGRLTTKNDSNYIASLDVQAAIGQGNTVVTPIQLATMCATIANGFVSSGVDLIMANATPALQAAQSATDSIPVLGTSVTEYGVALGLTDFDGVVGGNISGTSDLAPLDQQAEMIVEWMPEAKKVGLLYCSAEANSQYQVDEVQKYLEAKGVTATQYAFSDSNDLSSVCQKAADENDALYVPTDNTVAANTGIVDGICRPAKKPVFAGEEGICAGCGVATLSISYYDLGYTTGEMAVKILKGESDVSDMPIEYTDVTKKYNKTICDDLGLTVPEGYEAIEG